MKYIIVILVFISASACLKTEPLPNGYTRIAVNKKMYANKAKFDKSILNNIDTAAIYEAYRTVYYADKPTQTLARLDYRNPDTYYGCYRFYNNGCFNYFILNSTDSILTCNMFDPKFSGERGVYYKDKNTIKGDMITSINGAGTMGKITKTFTFKGDTLMVHYIPRLKDEIYIKRKLPAGLLTKSANW